MQPEVDPDAGWVARLSGHAPREAARALTEKKGDRDLYRRLARAHASEGRTSYIEIDAPRELLALVRLNRPTHVVEVGVSSGVSSAYLLQGLAENGHGTLHSIDLPSRPRSKTRSTNPSWSLPDGRSSGWAVPMSLRARWDLRLGDKQVVLPLLAEELDRIDLFVYDVPHEDRTSLREFRTVSRRVPAGGIAIADHGPGGGLCEALDRWATLREASPVGRTGLGLYGFRAKTAGP